MKTWTRAVRCALLGLSMSWAAIGSAQELDGTPAAVAPAAAPSNGMTLPAWTESLRGLYFRLGGLYIAPTGRSREVEFQNVSPMAQLSGLSDGPIAGSWVSMGSNVMAAATIGYSLPFLNRQLSVETILAAPFTMKMNAGGTLASTSLAPVALGVLPTGVQALGTDLGEATVLPPVLTAVYRFLPQLPIRPYIGVGVNLMVVMSARITNPILAPGAPKVSIPPKVGWVAQAGVDARLYGPFFLTADFKYIGGLDITTKVSDLWVRLPSLPLYGATKVGDNIVRMSIDPIVVQVGVGMNL